MCFVLCSVTKYPKEEPAYRLKVDLFVLLKLQISFQAKILFPDVSKSKECWQSLLRADVCCFDGRSSVFNEG